MYNITREYKWASAHQIEGHEKCGRLHGHNYRMKVTISSEELDEMGFVIDFGKMDEYIKPLINRMDHRYLASNYGKNTPLVEWLKRNRPDDICFLNIVHTTVESMTEFIAKRFLYSMPNNIKSIRINLWETDKNSCEVRLSR